jgi:poly-beta-1,6-N-acetyl-D-glucosamine N-deacetylase PgaB
VTASNLVSFFEWLHANSWTAITLDDLERARSGVRALPNRAVLITFDDGYRSLYTRVYPLLLVYKFPVVAALVGSWMEGTKRETVREEDNLIPGTDALITWDEAREMARSGLVEFASHSYELHHSRVANPLGGDQPAGVTLEYYTGKGYETEASYRQRIRADLEHSRALMQKELGRPPRALAWPFGRYTQAARQEALAAKYEFLLTMDPEPGFPEDLPQVPRLYPVRDPDLPTMVDRVVPDPSGAVRLVGLNPSTLLGRDARAFEKKLGAAIERVRVLGATTVIVDAAIRGASNQLEGVWFPNQLLPVKADVLSRIVWQMRTRAHVQVAVSVPVSAARATLGSDDAVLRLFEDLGYSASADALLLDQAPALAAIPLDSAAGRFSWEVRRRRNAVNLSSFPAADALALRLFLHLRGYVRRTACLSWLHRLVILRVR